MNSSGLSDSSDLMLQMDIEGGEYNCFLNMSPALLARFRVMVIEFHFLEDLWQPRFFNLVETVFDKILQSHICVHSHPNNNSVLDNRLGIEIPNLIEFTFMRKDSAKIVSYASNFPHELDYDNKAHKDSMILLKIWYKSD